ncbi:LANO_0F08526g1_1 [Lachancea nothofagi CBS 11611]|uniref:LANO_0F08526g1_1 n=1 Tax=Lachancea nothofagi CBS 11611 TaxID=1266666 RepID=A0A1G4K9F2_9SACH|nr:LANO_0F08526g1_1 [Lachancea nothofagi CBS 11611]
MVKPGVLFIAEPDSSSRLYATVIKEEFQVETLELNYSDPESFLTYLCETFDSKSKPLTAIYGGFPAFHVIGGLTSDIIEDARFPKDTLKCIVLCSRGVNGIDLAALKKYDIKVYNYTDEEGPETYGVEAIEKIGLVSNDVADCALWHVLEGYRKFSYQQLNLRKTGNTLNARRSAAGKNPLSADFMFGQELKSYDVRSPKGQKGLILGLGGIGKQIALKLHYGLGMEIHYAKRNCDPTVSWLFHELNDSLYSKLSQFTTIVVALPGTLDTRHLIDTKFLSHCNDNLVIVNIGRGTIFDPQAIESAISKKQIRHFGLDVFYNEPEVESCLLADDESVTITPHIGSGTKDNFYQSCEFALNNILEVVIHGSPGYSRVN